MSKGNGLILITAASCKAATALPMRINDSASRINVVTLRNLAMGNFMEYFINNHPKTASDSAPDSKPHRMTEC